MITELTLPSTIKSIEIGNLNNILIITSRSLSYNRFWRVNMELLARKMEFPVLEGIFKLGNKFKFLDHFLKEIFRFTEYKLSKTVLMYESHIRLIS